VKNEFNFKNTHIINKAFKYENGRKEIDLLLIGEELPKDAIDSLKTKLAKYNISDSQLFISQGLNAKQQIDFSQIKASILEDVFAKQNAGVSSISATQNTGSSSGAFPDVKSELRALYPSIIAYTITKATISSIDTARTDSITLFIADFRKPLPRSEQVKLKNWLKSRLLIHTDSLQVMVRVSKRIQEL
jgi:hypothetical protein